MEIPPGPFQGLPPDRDQCVLSQAIPFNRSRWREKVTSLDARLWPSELDECTVPDSAKWPTIDRRQVFQIANAGEGEDAAGHTYIAAAVWGTGTSAQGVARRLKVLSGDQAGTLRVLAETIDKARNKGAKAAYDHLHGSGRSTNRISNLGSSFGTKVLYFAGYEASRSPRPLILDQFVAEGLNRLCGFDWRTVQGGWESSQYEQYLGIAEDWTREWRVPGGHTDLVERVLFDIGKAPSLAISSLVTAP